MLKTVLLKLGMAVFSVLPIERIVAMLLNKWVSKLDFTNLEKAAKTAEHLAELAALLSDIVEDNNLTPQEVTAARKYIMGLRTDILAIWAKGDTAKSLQTSLVAQGVKAEYAAYVDGGFVRLSFLGLLGAVCACLLLCGGCLTRTRCQEINAETVYVTINNNDPDTLAENAYPRSLTILSQDQMVEGGTDSIASGNRTDPSLSVPMGDSALGALGALAGGAIGGYNKVKETPAKAGDAAADCLDGNCSD